MTHDEEVADHAMQVAVANVLRFGVLIAAAMTLLGGVVLLVQRGGTPVAFGAFRGQPEGLESLAGIVRGTFALDGASMTQFGILLLIATPVTRVALTLVAFLVQRDRQYVLITGIVLVLLLYGLVWGTG